MSFKIKYFAESVLDKHHNYVTKSKDIIINSGYNKHYNESAGAEPDRVFKDTVNI